MSNAITLPLVASATSAERDTKRSAHEMFVDAAKLTSEETSESRAAREAQLTMQMRRRRERLAAFVHATVPALLGFALFVLVWQFLAQINNQIPSPAKVWAAAVKLFSDPFYSKGPNDQGIGWNILSSLKRVGIGFGLGPVNTNPEARRRRAQS